MSGATFAMLVAAAAIGDPAGVEFPVVWTVAELNRAVKAVPLLVNGDPVSAAASLKRPERAADVFVWLWPSRLAQRYIPCDWWRPASSTRPVVLSADGPP